MKIFTRIIGNVAAPEWRERAAAADKEYIELDQWTAQKSRFASTSDRGNEYAVSLERNSRINDGDILFEDARHGTMLVVRVRLNDVMAIDMSSLASMPPQTIIHIAVELGHAIGNQHWPAVVKGTKVYVPLTVDKKVMLAVLETHHIEDITYRFEEGTEIIPYLAPHEIRRLFGGAGHESHAHVHTDASGHPHIHDAHIHE